MSSHLYSPFQAPSDPLEGVTTLAELEAVVSDANRTSAGTSLSGGWPEMQSLGTELPSVMPFDPGLLPEALRALAEDVADRMQVPLDFPAVISVATLAGLCGRRASIQPKKHDSSWIVVPNLWGGLVASPGTMKSPVITCITKAARNLECEYRTSHIETMREHEEAKERARLDHAVWQEEYKRNAKRNLPVPKKPETPLSAPVQPRFIAVDATFESLHSMLSENPAGIFVLRDELSGWLASLEKPGREAERAFFLECWNGDSAFTIDRIGRGSIHVEHCCVSLFGGIQPAKLRAYLADTLRDGPTNDGLIQRFQLLVWPDIDKNWSYRDRSPDGGAMRLAEDAYRRIAQMKAENPLQLGFSSDAQELFIAWLTDLETRLRRDDVTAFMQAHLSKYRKLMPALALLFSLADGSLETVSLKHAQQAADWCDYLEPHACRVYASRITPERLAASSLGKKLIKGWRRDERCFTLRDVYQNDWTGLDTPDEVRAAVRLLEDAGWLRRKAAKSETGRPSEIYDINPQIGEANADN